MPDPGSALSAAASRCGVHAHPPDADFPYTTPLLFELEGLSCGYDFGAPATEGYQPPFTFTGTIHTVTVEVSGELIRDDDADIARLMAQQ